MLDSIMLPDWQAILMALGGGALMGWMMFKFLPGMRANAYTPREWIPVGIVLSSLGWFTYFVPQFAYDHLDRGRDFWVQAPFVLVLFISYMSTLMLMLYICQKRAQD